jgi:hypothetical protein
MQNKNELCHQKKQSKILEVTGLYRRWSMTVQELIDKNLFKIVNVGTDTDRQISKLFCCDLLSIAMGRAPAGCAWVTVMGNINTLAVTSLTDASCVILAEGVVLDEAASAKAKVEDITVLSTDMPIFDAALAIHEALNA